MTESVLDAFLGQLILVSLDLNYLKLECEGLADYTVSSDILNCTDPSQIRYCQIRNRLTNREVITLPEMGMLGSELESEEG